MLGDTFDSVGSAVAEKRKIQSKEGRSSTPLAMKWRYKRVWRKRVLMLIMFAVALHQFYKAFAGVELAGVPKSWLGGLETGESSFRIMRSTMKRTTNPTGRAAAPVSQRRSKKQERTNSTLGTLHLIEKGLLAVDTSLPVTAHPILQLTQNARQAWDSKVARQSKTLRNAVNEYKRRNRGRNPPKGFDKWWQLVKSVALKASSYGGYY
jgi:hypothetical protein